MVIGLVDFTLADNHQPRQQLRHLLRCKIFAARLARVRRVHTHENFVGVAERVDGVIFVAAELHIAL